MDRILGKYMRLRFRSTSLLKELGGQRLFLGGSIISSFLLPSTAQ